MSLSQEHKARQSNGGVSIFKQGVESVRLCAKSAVNVFRLMPAFDPANPDPASSYLPAVLPDGEPSDWGKYIVSCNFIGYGQNKRNLVSPRTVSDEAPCPLFDLWDAIKSDKTIWGYMIDENTGRENVFKKPGASMVVNCVNLQKVNLGVVIGILNKSAADSLYGLVTAKNTNPMMKELIAKNYLAGYANGDVSDPGQGVHLACQVDPNKKKGASYSEYAVSVLNTRNPATGEESFSSFPVNGPWLQRRYRLMDPNSYLTIKSYEELVTDLVGMFNRRSPEGYHEWDLLRAAFPNYAGMIPQAPAAPAAMRSVAPGWDNQGGGVGNVAGQPLPLPLPLPLPAPSYNTVPPQGVVLPVPQQQVLPLPVPQQQATSPEQAHLQRQASTLPPAGAVAPLTIPGDAIPLPPGGAPVSAGGVNFLSKLRSGTAAPGVTQ